MGPPSEGRPSGDGRNFGAQGYTEDGRRYQPDRDVVMQDRYHSDRDMPRQDRYQHDRDIDMHDQSLPPPTSAFGLENRLTASPSGSASGRERDREGDLTKTSEERNRSRTRNGRTASGQLRLCKKCGEPLTGQFVRALSGTYHLDCFRCRVRDSCCACSLHSLTVFFYI